MSSPFQKLNSFLLPPVARKEQDNYLCERGAIMLDKKVSQ
jgi:hypothetical protein